MLPQKVQRLEYHAESSLPCCNPPNSNAALYHGHIPNELCLRCGVFSVNGSDSSNSTHSDSHPEQIPQLGLKPHSLRHVRPKRRLTPTVTAAECQVTTKHSPNKRENAAGTATSFQAHPLVPLFQNRGSIQWLINSSPV
jgi:hypothetical protein